jgi:hypothetical protein
MITPKILLNERLTQSFQILKSNFLKLVLPIFVYQFITLVIIWTLISTLILWWINLADMDWYEVLYLLSDPKFILFIIVWTIFYIVYLLLFIPILLWIIKTVHNILNWEKINLVNNFKYWFKNILNSFKTYWFVFSFVALIPSLILIVWWLLILFWYFIMSSKILWIIWIIISFIGMIYFISSLTYRWLKAKFAIYSAVDKNEFTKENFLNSIKNTKDNWWRILWNLLLVWLIIIVLSWITTFLLSFINFWFWNIIINKIFFWFISNIITTIFAVYSIIFTYLLFKTLELENIWNEQIENIENKKIENLVEKTDIKIEL